MLLQHPLLSCVLVSLVSSIEDNAYCSVRYSRLCQEKGQHVACQFPDPGPGDACENYTQIKFNDDLKYFILNYVNRRRQKIAAGHERVRGGLTIPKPTIMMYVEWDRELAFLAQRLADQCFFMHDECRATVRYPYAGQTVGEVRWRRSLESDDLMNQRAIRKVLDAWWGEKRRVLPQHLINPFKVNRKGTVVWGHFSQLAIWKLRAIGCGAVLHGPPHPRMLLVCDFSHTNMLGQKTISAGPQLACPAHTARRPHSQYPLLCSTISYPVLPQDLAADYEDPEDELDIPASDNNGVYELETDTAVETIEEDHKAIVTTARNTPELDIYVKRTKIRKEEKNMLSSRRKPIKEDEVKTNMFTRIRPSISKYSDRNIMTNHNPKTKMFTDGVKPRQHLHIVETNHLPMSSREAEQFTEKTRVVDKYHHREYSHEKIPPYLSQDYSVIPLRHQPERDMPAPWRPKLFWRTSTTHQPLYDTSVAHVLQDIKRKHYDTPIRRPTIILREKVIPHSTRRIFAHSLKLDKEDIDQLFKDTGFKLNWTPKG